jgi:hypothetical protein
VAVAKINPQLQNRSPDRLLFVLVRCRFAPAEGTATGGIVPLLLCVNFALVRRVRAPAGDALGDVNLEPGWVEYP